MPRPERRDPERSPGLAAAVTDLLHQAADHEPDRNRVLRRMGRGPDHLPLPGHLPPPGPARSVPLAVTTVGIALAVAALVLVVGPDDGKVGTDGRPAAGGAGRPSAGAAGPAVTTVSAHPGTSGAPATGLAGPGRAPAGPGRPSGPAPDPRPAADGPRAPGPVPAGPGATASRTSTPSTRAPAEPEIRFAPGGGRTAVTLGPDAADWIVPAARQDGGVTRAENPALRLEFSARQSRPWRDGPFRLSWSGGTPEQDRTDEPGWLIIAADGGRVDVTVPALHGPRFLVFHLGGADAVVTAGNVQRIVPGATPGRVTVALPVSSTPTVVTLAPARTSRGAHIGLAAVELR